MVPNYSSEVVKRLQLAGELLREVPFPETSDLQIRHRKLLLRVIDSIELELERIERRIFLEGSSSNIRKRKRFLIERKETCLKLL